MLQQSKTLSEQSKKVHNTMTSMNVGGVVPLRSTITTVILALNVSNALDLPSSRVDSIANHFGEMHHRTVGDMIVRINEVTPINIKQVFGLVETIYTMRYSLVFPNRAGKLACLPLAITSELITPEVVSIMGAFNSMSLSAIRFGE